MKRITRTCKYSTHVIELLNGIKEQLGINYTYLIEMAVIEKYHKMGIELKNVDKNDIKNYIDELIRKLEKLKKEI